MAFGILFRDKNLLAENIKKGVRILKVTGTCEGGGGTINNQDITADSSVALQAFTAGEGYDGIGVFTLRPYSRENRTVDSSTSVQVITPETADCLWTVLVNPYILDSKTVDSSTVSQTVVSSADGLGSVTVNPYTLDSKTIDSSTVQQVVTSSADGLSSVTVNPYVLDSKTVDSSTVSQTVNSSADGLSSVTVNPYTLDSKTVDSSTVQQVITSNEDGLSSVTVNPYVLDTRTVNSSTSQQVITPVHDGMSQVTVNPYVLDTKTVDPSTSQVTVNSSADGMSQVTVNAVTSSIDANIQAGNIKDGVSILGVTGTYDGSGGGTPDDWVANAKKEIDLDMSSHTLQPTRYYEYSYLFWKNGVYAAEGKYPTIIMGNSYGFYNAFINFVMTGSDLNIYGTTSYEYELYNTFSTTSQSGEGDIKVSFPQLTSFSQNLNTGYHFYQTFYNNMYIGGVTFPVLTTIPGGLGTRHMLYETFYKCANLRYVRFPELTAIYSSADGFTNTFQYCNWLSEFSVPKLTTIRGNTSEYYTVFNGTFINSGISTLSFPELTEATMAFYNCFGPSITTMSTPKLSNYNTLDRVPAWSGTNNVTTITTHPNPLKGNSVYNNLYWPCSNTTSLTLTQNATDDIHLDNMGSLDSSSIIGVLQHLDANTSGKSCTYFTNGISITDDAQHSVTALYNADTSAGWTINNLSIILPDVMITYPAAGSFVDPFDSSNYIEFDALDSWTAVTSSNDITLSAYSGSAGNGQTVTVTATAGWSGDASVTITANGVSKSATVKHANVTFVDWIEPTSGAGADGAIDLGFNIEPLYSFDADYYLQAKGTLGMIYTVASTSTSGSTRADFSFGNDSRYNEYYTYYSMSADRSRYFYMTGGGGLDTRYRVRFGFTTNNQYSLTALRDFDSTPSSKIQSDTYYPLYQNTCHVFSSTNYGKLYSLKVYSNLSTSQLQDLNDSTAPIFNFRPAIVNNQYGLYETVNGTFHTTANGAYTTGGND